MICSHACKIQPSDSDPLQLSEPEGKSLEWVLSGVRPNIMGRFCRNLVFDAMLDYFQRGADFG